MTEGAIVTHRTDPLAYGKMLVVRDTGGWLICEAVHKNRQGEYPRNPFRPDELELCTEPETATA